jgi:hypothetical protein
LIPSKSPTLRFYIYPFLDHIDRSVFPVPPSNSSPTARSRLDLRRRSQKEYGIRKNEEAGREEGKTKKELTPSATNNPIPTPHPPNPLAYPTRPRIGIHCCPAKFGGGGKYYWGC